MELELLSSKRKEKRKLDRDFKKGKVNQQYSYTTREAIATFKDMHGDFDWIPSKEGQSIKKWWIDRINQQRTASNLTKAKPMGCFGVHGNDSVELDNDIRDFICDTELHISVDFEDDGAGTEWILTRVTSKPTTFILALENSVSDKAYEYYMDEGNIHKVFYLCDGKRSSTKPIWRNPHYKPINEKKLQDFVDFIRNC